MFFIPIHNTQNYTVLKFKTKYSPKRDVVLKDNYTDTRTEVNGGCLYSAPNENTRAFGEKLIHNSSYQ